MRTASIDRRPDHDVSNDPMAHRLNRFVREYVRITRWRFALALTVSLLYSLTEGAGIALLPLILQTAGFKFEGQGVVGRYADAISASLKAVGLRPSLMLMLALFVAIVGARAILGRVQAIVSLAVEKQFEVALRTRLYRAIAGAAWVFIARIRATDLTHAMTAEMDRIGTGAFELEALCGGLIMAIVYTAISMTLSAPMTLMVGACGVALAIAIRGRTEEINDTGDQVSSATRAMYAASIENIQSIKAAKAYGAEARQAGVFEQLAKGVASAHVKVAGKIASAAAAFELGSVAILAAILYVAIRVIAVPPEAVLILMLLFARMMPRIMAAHRNYRAVTYALPSFANVMRLEARCLAAAEHAETRERAPNLQREIALDRVTFSYAADRAPALNGLSLAIPAGGIVAIVGPSGAGKSTAADMLMGLLVPDSGEVRIDGATLKPNQIRDWRERIGYVAPETVLFHGTIRDNLKWARDDAAEDDMWAALRLAAADRFVAELPHALDTIVGDRGILISQGERQRIALARAFLRRPSLLVLDEATNSLDSVNESLVLGALESMRGRITVVLIAHRISTIRWADIVYVVENGTVVESGKLDELARRDGGRFRALSEMQTVVG
jgi:ATP-binding cassette subfamily C protein